jgi:hypothetical protein
MQGGKKKTRLIFRRKMATRKLMPITIEILTLDLLWSMIVGLIA